MPPTQGETTLLTVYGDVHYFFDDPDSFPTHHRFDKGSYIYLYHNTTSSQGRLEIANRPGKKHQDAVAGLLDDAVVSYSSLRPSQMTITANAAASSNEKVWTLWSLDVKNKTGALFTVKQLDIYFWREEDAQLMLNALTRFSIESFLIDDAEVKHSGHEIASSLVEKLEYAAEEAPSRSSSPSTTASVTASSAAPSFVPAAYNPASPAAPERIVYREKTPPPPDTEINLAASLTNETALLPSQTAYQQHQFGQASPPLQQQTAYYNILPTSPIRLSSYQAELLLSPNAQQIMSFAPPPKAQATTPEQLHTLFSPQATPSTPPSIGNLPFRTSSGAQPTYPRTQYATYNIPPPPPAPPSVPPQVEHSPPGHMHYMGQMYSPMYNSNMQGHASPSLYSPGHSQYGTPTTGNFAHPSYAGSVPASPYAIHSQVYRPDEGEVGHGNHAGERKTSGGVLDVVDARAQRVEKGVGKWLKRLDKRL